MRGCAYFGRKLTIPIEPKNGPGAILETLEDCAKFMGHMHRWRQARPHWEFAAELILRDRWSVPCGVAVGSNHTAWIADGILTQIAGAAHLAAPSRSVGHNPSDFDPEWLPCCVCTSCDTS
jgi:hypothetical protein